jgi:WD40 repeat protein
VGASTGLYFYQPGDYALVHSIDTQAAISELAISPDSQVVAAVTADQVFIYQISDLRLISTIPAQANSVDFSPDGKLLALGIQGDPSNLQIRDAVTGEILQSFHNEQAAWAVKMSPRGDFIATGGFSTTIWALDGTIKEQNGPYVSGGSTYSVSFSPDGKFLAEGADYFLHIWRVLENGRLIIYRDIDLSRFDYSSVSNVAISPSGKLVAVTLSQGVYAWELATGACVLKIPTRFTLYSSLAWSADSQAISATSNEAGVQVWDVATGQSLASLNTHNGTFASLVWSPDGQKRAAGADEGTAYLFNVPDGAVIQRLGSDYGLNSLAFSADGHNLAVGYNNRLVEIWDLGGTISQTLLGFGYGSSDATFSTDGSFFAASLAESWQTPPQVRFWNTRDWNVEKTFSVGDRDNYMITGFALAPDQSTGAIAYVDMRGYHKELIQIISVADEAVITYLEPKGKRYRVSILSMAYSPDGARLAVRVDEYVDPNPRLLVWQTSHWELLYEQSLVAGGLRLGWAANKQDSLAWSPDGKLLAVGMQDGSVQILEANSGKRLVNLTGHTLWATGVAFSPDGRLLASCSIDGTIILWGIR